MAVMSALHAMPLEQIAMPPDHVVVGVDLGMTCTGVAVWSSSRRGLPVVIQQWPGTHELHNKVSTTLIYQAGQSRVCSWGFTRPRWEFGYGLGVVERFKFFLDEEKLENGYKDTDLKYPKPDIGDVRKWFKDFLHGLHGHVVEYLSSEFGVDWHSTKVDYIFGLPTPWRERNALIDDFQNIVAQAGFEKRLNCDVTIRLTEAEAAAVFTSKSLNHKYKVRDPRTSTVGNWTENKLQKGDIILVCDAGGGTTDVCILEVLHTEGEIIELKALSEPNALYAGSTQIDRAFEVYAERFLKHNHPWVPKHVARDMAKNKFQAVKLAFGTKEAVPIENIPIPGLEYNIELPSDILKTMFDEQIGKIVRHIEKEIELLRERLPRSKILYLVLVGGLGSSEYLRTETKEYCRPQGITVLCPDGRQEPPLAVCKGLVMDWLQRFEHRTSILPARLSGTSYGILCSERYDKAKHAGQNRTKNYLNNKEYVINQIDWFIRKGDSMPKDKPITRNIFRLLSSDCQTKRQWRAFIVRSPTARERLPTFFERGDPTIEVVCQISSDLAPTPDTPGITKKRKYVVVGKKYISIKYELSISIEQENLEFRARMLLSGEESETNMPPQSLEVRWIPTATGDDNRQQELPMDESSEEEFLDDIFMSLHEP